MQYIWGSAELEALNRARDARSLLETASSLASAQIEQRPPSILEHHTDVDSERMAISRRTGQILGRSAANAATSYRFIMTLDALRYWIPDCGLRMREVYRKEIPEALSLPADEIRDKFFGRILGSDWIAKADKLQALAVGMRPILQPDSKEKDDPAWVFALGTRHHIDTRLRTLRDSNAEKHNLVTFFAALTDSGALDERIWGDIGIGAFTPDTPFVVTEETWRRFVLRHRDSYAPVDERSHVDVLGKYCFNVLKQVLREKRERHTSNVEKLDSHLRLSDGDELRMPLRGLIRVANGIIRARGKGASANFQKGTLPETSRTSVGPALDIFLSVTRREDHPMAAEQKYRDSVHVEIMHELGVFGADLRRVADPSQPEKH